MCLCMCGRHLRVNVRTVNATVVADEDPINFLNDPWLNIRGHERRGHYQ